MHGLLDNIYLRAFTQLVLTSAFSGFVTFIGLADHIEVVPFILKDYIVYSSSDDFAYKLIFVRMSNSTVPFITSTTIRVF